MTRFGESLIKKVASSRRSLRSSAKKDKNKSSKQKLLFPVSEATAEEKKEEKEEEEVEVELEEIEEAYMLPEIPHTPLSGTSFYTCGIFTCLSKEG